MKDYVVLVDKDDKKLGLMDKLEAHKGKGTLHRAVSVLLYRRKNGKTDVLLQQRSNDKPLWPMFWSNTVCTHPRDGEESINCCVRRLMEEMGIRVRRSDVTFLFKLLYQAKYNDTFSEYELDSVFVGEWTGQPKLNLQEGMAWKWMDWNDLQRDMVKNRRRYTPWFNKLISDKRTFEALSKDYKD